VFVWGETINFGYVLDNMSFFLFMYG